ncbi:MAG TPA: hypothetical protein VG817_09095, partial [Gemmatimonadales bacterium]|nr:hypothetical protein [Gemmatimonadales bacterium]
MMNHRSGATIDSTAAAFRATFPKSNDVWEAEWYAAWYQRNLAKADSIARDVQATARTPRQQVRSAGGIAASAELQGRITEALRWNVISEQALLRVEPSNLNRLQLTLDSVFILAQVPTYRARSRTALDQGLARVPLATIPPTDRPYADLAILSAIFDDPALAKQAWQGWERDQRANVPDSLGARAFYQAHVALAEKRWHDAITLSQDAYNRFSLWPRYAPLILARAWDGAGQPDSAIAQYEAFLKVPNWNPQSGSAIPGARAWARLGELYEAKGDLARASNAYARFIEQWEKADPELQPEVKEARARLAAIKAKQG